MQWLGPRGDRARQLRGDRPERELGERRSRYHACDCVCCGPCRRPVCGSRSWPPPPRMFPLSATRRLPRGTLLKRCTTPSHPKLHTAPRTITIYTTRTSFWFTCRTVVDSGGCRHSDGFGCASPTVANVRVVADEERNVFHRKKLRLQEESYFFG